MYLFSLTREGKKIKAQSTDVERMRALPTAQQGTCVIDWATGGILDLVRKFNSQIRETTIQVLLRTN